MFWKKKVKEVPAIEVAIQTAFDKLTNHDAGTDEYAKIINQIDLLYKMKAYEKPNVVQKDTLVSILGMLLNTGFMMGFEKAGNVFTTKAVSFAPKPKLPNL